MFFIAFSARRRQDPGDGVRQKNRLLADDPYEEAVFRRGFLLTEALCRAKGNV
jgi:hypothetical protein